MTDANTEKPSGFHTFILITITFAGFALSFICFGWYTDTAEVALLLLGLVTFGMSYDFLNHVIGIYLRNYEGFLKLYSRINFAALCFGIPFTAFAGTFVMAEVVPDGINAKLVDNYLTILHASVLFGLLFLAARYKKIDVHRAIEFTLDKGHTYTKVIFIARRILLAASLVLGILVLVDAWGTEWQWWAVAFVGVFVASVPLHILHKQIPSMLSEVFTQAIAMYASYYVFVA